MPGNRFRFRSVFGGQRTVGRDGGTNDLPGGGHFFLFAGVFPDLFLERLVLQEALMHLKGDVTDRLFRRQRQRLTPPVGKVIDDPAAAQRHSAPQAPNQSRLSRSIGPQDGPLFVRADLPRRVRKDQPIPQPDGNGINGKKRFMTTHE